MFTTIFYETIGIMTIGYIIGKLIEYIVFDTGKKKKICNYISETGWQCTGDGQDVGGYKCNCPKCKRW